MPALEEGENVELADFRRRFWWALPLTVVVKLLASAGYSPRKGHFRRDRGQQAPEPGLCLHLQRAWRAAG